MARIAEYVHLLLGDGDGDGDGDDDGDDDDENAASSHPDKIDEAGEAEVSGHDLELHSPFQLASPLEDGYDAKVAHARTGRQLPSTAMTATTPSPQRTGVSPSSSPRLPSPPPFTEVQIGPKSPTIGAGPEKKPGEAAKQDDGSTRRIRPGTKAADMSSGPPLIPLAELESPFQLQEHLKALYHVHIRSNSETVTPLTRQTALTLSTPPAGIERPLWLYELCRFLTMKANNLITAFFADSPACSASTCPEMRASEWQYLCAVHDPPKSCCAIDYCCHTLDWAANILTSPKYFPSRLTIGGEMGGGGGGSQASMRHLTNIFRRVYRIFAHAWFQHRGVFWQVEGNEGLYIFFKTVCDVYQLIPEDNYTIPREAEAADGDSLETPVGNQSPDMAKMSVLKKNGDTENAQTGEDADNEATTTVSVGATTRRHKHTPSTGSHVTTIAEGLEEEEPWPKEGEEERASEQAEPSRGRPLPSTKEPMPPSLEEPSPVDLPPAAYQDTPAETPTVQPDDVEKVEKVEKVETDLREGTREETPSDRTSDDPSDRAVTASQTDLAAEGQADEAGRPGKVSQADPISEEQTTVPPAGPTVASTPETVTLGEENDHDMD